MAFPSIQDVIAHFRSHNLSRRRRDLAELLTGLATDPRNGGFAAQQHYWGVNAELTQAFSKLSSTTTDLLITAVLKTMALCSDLPIQCFRLAQELKRRTPQPRNIERDIAIVRMRDEGELSFGQIAQSLSRPTSKRLTRDAVERAYKRMKAKLQAKAMPTS
jgi:hypothetical protein